MQRGNRTVSFKKQGQEMQQGDEAGEDSAWWEDMVDQIHPVSWDSLVFQVQ